MIVYIQLVSLSSSLTHIVMYRAFTLYLIVFKTMSVDLTFACHIASFRVCHIWYTRQLNAMQNNVFFVVGILHFFATMLLSEGSQIFDPSHFRTASKHVLLNLDAKNKWSMDSFSAPQSGQDLFGVTPNSNRRSLVLSLLWKASLRMNLVLGAHILTNQPCPVRLAKGGLQFQIYLVNE